MEFLRILSRACGLSRNRIATASKERASSDEIHCEFAQEVMWADDRCCDGWQDFPAQLIVPIARPAPIPT